MSAYKGPREPGFRTARNLALVMIGFPRREWFERMERVARPAGPGA